MLSPSDIRPAIREVLLSTGNSLASYQILDRLPVSLRDQILSERGLPGAGSGNSYSAASLVTDAVEVLLPSLDAPYRVYLDVRDMKFSVAGNDIQPGNNAIAFYRLPATVSHEAAVNVIPESNISSAPPLMDAEHRVSPTFTVPPPLPHNTLPEIKLTKTPWYDKSGFLVLWFILFWPVGVYGFFKSTQIPKVVKIIVPLVFLGIGAFMNATNTYRPSGGKESEMTSLPATYPEIQANPEPQPETNDATESEVAAPPANLMEWHQIERFTGDSIKSTETFEVNADEWRISWDTRGGKLGNMNFQIYVYEADGSMKDIAANVVGKSEDSTVIRGKGRYYLKFITAQPYAVEVQEYR